MIWEEGKGKPESARKAGDAEGKWTRNGYTEEVLKDRPPFRRDTSEIRPFKPVFCLKPV